MDIAAAGAAASQISAAQRAQQVSIAALRSNNLQAQSLASMLGNAAASGTGAASAPQPTAPAAAGGNGGDTGGGSSQASNAASPRGSLLNILV
jgi:hypothetical protein